MKTALVISGGGCKGAFAVGAIEYLLENGANWDIIVGTSTGALLTPLVSGGKFDAAKKIYSNIRTRDLIRKYCWLTIPWRAAIYNDKGLRNVIRKHYTDGLHADLNAGTRVSEVCTVSLNTGEVCYWNPKDVSRDVFMRALLASSNQPGLMPPVQINKGSDFHLDGGVREIAPIQRAADLGAEKITSIVLEPEYLPSMPGDFGRIPKILLRTLSLMTTEIRNDDVKVDGVIEMTTIRPTDQLTANSLEFVPAKMREMIKKGYQRAKEVVSG